MHYSVLGDLPERPHSTIPTYHDNLKKRFHLKDTIKSSIKIVDTSSLLNTNLVNLNDSDMILQDYRLSKYNTIYIFLKFTCSLVEN